MCLAGNHTNFTLVGRRSILSGQWKFYIQKYHVRYYDDCLPMGNPERRVVADDGHYPESPAVPNSLRSSFTSLNSTS